MTLNSSVIYYMDGRSVSKTLRQIVKVSYNKLWKTLIDRKMRKSDLRNRAHISTTALAKLGRDENVSMDVLKKICAALECNVGDIMDILPDSKS